MHKELPTHLKKYVVQQIQDSYTPRDQAVWRFSLRQLKHFLGKFGHESYLSGLEKTGINIETIPNISDINEKLNLLGWSAVPVSGFIPPRAFMEFQSLGFLPIASDIRTYQHILYTPAPDIIHEAAGHAPILSDQEFSEYLQNYAEVAGKAILNKKDILLYEAIRELSDIKEHPNSSQAEVEASTKKLERVADEMGSPSEAAILGRMNWWTAEYGLVGDIDSPKIFGAGLLSSIQESENSLKSTVKKLPLTLDCINYSYDITEEQPQLFVTPDFKHLTKVLNELAETMAFKMGGSKGLATAKNAETVNTIELNSGIQISGLLESFDYNEKDSQVTYFKTKERTQLSFGYSELDKQGCDFHKQGYSCVMGTINSKCLSQLEKTELDNLGFKTQQKISYTYDNGINVSGKIKDLIFRNEKLILIEFVDCTVKKEDRIYFQPDWGKFDLAVGSSVKSVYGGPSDPIKFGEVHDYPAKRIPDVKYSNYELSVFEIYKHTRNLRTTPTGNADEVQTLIEDCIKNYPTEWLLLLELLELALHHELSEPYVKLLEVKLDELARSDDHSRDCIIKGLKLASQLVV